ncbi:MAG: sarcosine oxidase subunit gamma family protein [Pseudomonadota bacterium]
MSDPVLQPRQPLDGFERKIGELRVAELTGIALVSIATPLGGETKLADAVANAYKAQIPAVGQSTVADLDNTRFLGLQPGQIIAMFTYENDRAVDTVEARLGDTGYYTDQSDAWVVLEISGPGTVMALERICPIDLHPDAFPAGAATRTAMEHIGAVIIRTEDDSFLLMSARSSARSFLDAVIASLENIQ